MCKYLSIPISLVYYKKKQCQKNSDIENKIIKIFYESGKDFDAKKITQELEKYKTLTAISNVLSLLIQH